jgi:iron(III) transport system permease protein
MGHGTRVTITSVLVLFLTVFFLAPIITMVAFPLTRDPLFYLTFLLNDEVIGAALVNSLVVATVATILSAGLAAFLAYGFTALRFRGDRILQVLLLAPLVVPPFVGAMGLRKLLARYGPLNLWLVESGWLAEPIDFVGTGGIAAIALTQALHFYPVIFLTLVSGLATVDGRGWEAARLLGASRFRIIARVILPAIAPSMLAGCAAVFVWSFSDISTPLVFDYRPVLPIQLLELSYHRSICGLRRGGDVRSTPSTPDGHAYGDRGDLVVHPSTYYDLLRPVLRPLKPSADIYRD